MKGLSKVDIKSVFVLGSSSEIARSICIELAKNGALNFIYWQGN